MDHVGQGNVVVGGCGRELPVLGVTVLLGRRAGLVVLCEPFMAFVGGGSGVGGGGGGGVGDLLVVLGF